MSDYQYCCCRYQYGDRCCQWCRGNNHQLCSDKVALERRRARWAVPQSVNVAGKD